MLGGLLETLLATGHRPHLARQPHFAEHQQVVGQRPVAQAGHDCGHQRQVGRGFQHLDPAHDVEEHVLVVSRNPTVSMQHRQQHGEPILIQAQGDPARVRQVAVVHQRLHLDQHRPGALPSGHDHTAGDFFLGTRQKDRRRV
ncbi:hypothetical protein D3C78_1519150 [compost metagenome]